MHVFITNNNSSLFTEEHRLLIYSRKSLRHTFSIVLLRKLQPFLIAVLDTARVYRRLVILDVVTLVSGYYPFDYFPNLSNKFLTPPFNISAQSTT